jgi:hypothetical protein
MTEPEMPPRVNLKILLQRDFKPAKGITYSRQHIHRKVVAKTFPPPDGKTSDHPGAPNFWFETTIDKYLRQRAAAKRKQARAIREHAAVMRQRSVAMHAAKRAAPSTELELKQPTPAPSSVIGKEKKGKAGAREMFEVPSTGPQDKVPRRDLCDD